MADPFESSRRKIARANHHALDLAKRIDSFLKENPCERIIEAHPERADQFVHKIKFRRSINEPFNELLGDAAYNLRAALDHACYGVALSAGVIKPINAYFPFAIDSTDLERVMKGRSRDLPQEILPLFRALQPYKGGNIPLWTLNQIRNRDNHALLIPVVIIAEDISSKLNSTARSLVSMPLTHVWDGTKQEIEVATFRANGEFDYEIDVTVSVVFEEIEGINGIGGKSPIPFLDTAGHVVEDILRRIEGEARRLGFVN